MLTKEEYKDEQNTSLIVRSLNAEYRQENKASKATNVSLMETITPSPRGNENDLWILGIVGEREFRNYY